MNNLTNTDIPINRTFTTFDEYDDFTPILTTPPRLLRGIRRPRIYDRNTLEPLQINPRLINTPRPALLRRNRNRNPLSIRPPLFSTRKIAGKNKRKSRKRKITFKDSFKNKKRKL